MKKLSLLLVLFGMFAFVGCGEKTTGEKVDDAIEQGSADAEKAKEEAGKALENLGK